jgi:hypothetical protein
MMDTRFDGECMKKKTVPKKAASRPAKRMVSASPKAKAPGPVQDIQVRIAARAHELYEQRGCLDGYHLHDWLEAEQEILGHPVVMDKSSERI